LPNQAMKFGDSGEREKVIHKARQCEARVARRDTWLLEAFAEPLSHFLPRKRESSTRSGA
jgi:hypothetical protein